MSEEAAKYGTGDRRELVSAVLLNLEDCPDATEQTSISLSPMVRRQIEVVAAYHRVRPAALHRQLLEEVARSPGFRSLYREATESLRREIGGGDAHKKLL